MYLSSQDYVYDETRFLMDLAAAWNKLATKDRCLMILILSSQNFNEELFSGTMDLWAMYAINKCKIKLKLICDFLFASSCFARKQ